MAVTRRRLLGSMGLVLVAPRLARAEGRLGVAGALATPLPARAQARPPRVGAILYSATYAPALEGLRIGLKELGIAEGRDVVLDVRDARGDVRAIEAAAREFESEKAALIHSTPTTTTRAVKSATSAIPVVFCVGSDPVHMGLVRTYAKPEGRFTGVHYLTVDLTPKRLELLKELVPKARRIVTFYNPDNPVAQESARSARTAAPGLGLELLQRHVRSEAEIREALGKLKRSDADAIFYVSDATVSARSALIIGRAKALRMPLMVFDETLAEQGALASYGIDIREVGRQSAKYVQRVLAGARPADLPVENVTRFVFALNQRTAREIGVKIPPAMLVRFDRVIE